MSCYPSLLQPSLFLFLSSSLLLLPESSLCTTVAKKQPHPGSPPGHAVTALLNTTEEANCNTSCSVTRPSTGVSDSNVSSSPSSSSTVGLSESERHFINQILKPSQPGPNQRVLSQSNSYAFSSPGLQPVHPSSGNTTPSLNASTRQTQPVVAPQPVNTLNKYTIPTPSLNQPGGPTIPPNSPPVSKPSIQATARSPLPLFNLSAESLKLNGSVPVNASITINVGNASSISTTTTVLVASKTTVSAVTEPPSITVSADALRTAPPSTTVSAVTKPPSTTVSAVTKPPSTTVSAVTKPPSTTVSAVTKPPSTTVSAVTKPPSTTVSAVTEPPSTTVSAAAPSTNTTAINETWTSKMTTSTATTTTRMAMISTAEKIRSALSDLPSSPLKPDTASLLAVLLFGLLFFLVTVAVFVMQAFESYRRKDYTQVDYLINGMYTDSSV